MLSSYGISLPESVADCADFNDEAKVGEVTISAGIIVSHSQSQLCF